MVSLSCCLVSTFYPPASFGGDAVHVHGLATGLAERGVRVRVVHDSAAYEMLQGDRAGAAGHAPHPGVEVVSTPGRLASVSTYLTGLPIGYRQRLEELVTGFDVVHFHNPSLLGGPGSFAIGSGVRLYTTHEHWLMCPTHVLFRYGREVCTHRTCWRCTASYRRPPQLWRSTPLLRRSLRHIHALLAPSRFTADLHRQMFPEVPIEVLPLAAFRARDSPPAPADPPGGRRFFLYSGRLEPIKGVDRLIDAFTEVHGADLVIAGDGTQAAELRQRAAGNPSVRFLGRVPYEQVLALCRRAIAVVVPSVGYETFGAAAVEAMAVGTPALVRDLGPLPELVEDGGGLSFGNDSDLAARLQELVESPQLVLRLGNEAAAVAADRFGEERFFDRYFGIIAECADRTGLSAVGARARRVSGTAGVMSATSHVTILAYHAVENGSGPTCLSAARFARQVRGFRDAGCQALTVAEVADHVRERRPFPERAIALTFDDGYASVHHRALPLLAEVGFRATIFPVSSRLGGYNSWDASAESSGLRLVSAAHLTELVAAGWEVGGHTHAHRALPGLSPREVEEELTRSNAVLESVTGRPVRSFAYPYGRHDRETRRVAAAFYDACVVIGAAKTSTRSDVARLERVDAWYLRRDWQVRRLHDVVGDAYLASRRITRAAGQGLRRAGVRS